MARASAAAQPAAAQPDPFAAGLGGFSQGGICKLVDQYAIPGRLLRSRVQDGRSMALLDDLRPIYTPALNERLITDGVRAFLPGGLPWPASLQVRHDLSGGAGAFISVQESWLSTDLTIPAGQQLSFRWAFFNGEMLPAAGSADFALLRVEEGGAQVAQLLLANTVAMNSLGRGCTGWKVGKWPAQPASAPRQVRVTWLCCNGGFQIGAPAGWTPQSAGLDWRLYPSALLLDTFQVGAAVLLP